MAIYIPRNKKWSELTTPQKFGAILLPILQFTLLITALRDIRRRAPEEINGSKKWWTAAAFVNFVGPLAYFVWGRKRA
jgi:hypothetical protein